MAILSRLKVSPQQRYDLEDLLTEQSAQRTDSKLWTKSFLSELNLILSGFNVSGVGLSSATVAMSGATLIIPQSSTDFSFFVAAPAQADVTIADADLVNGVRNYVEAQLLTQDGTPLTKAFWDPQANSGNGQEFNQIVNTVTDLSISFTVSTGGFSGSVDKLPIAIIDCDNAGTIKIILDRRNLYGRLAKPNSLDNNYAWGTKVEPVYQLNLTSVTGTFVAGETIAIGGETATVVTGGTTSITFNAPTGINFANGSSVAGGTSSASGTVNTVFESFVGVDKNLNNQKKINDALMTEIKNVKKTRFWWQDAPTLIGLKGEAMSVTAGISGGARVNWDGSKLVITDDNLTPASTDNVAAIRIFSSTAALMLRRQDDGKEVVTISLSDIPDTGILTLNQNGHSIAINWNDSPSQIQTTWNGSGAYAAVITGSPAAKKIVIAASAAGSQVDVVQSSNTLSKSSVSVTPTISIKQGMASDSSIAIADGQVLYVDLPDPLSSTNYSGVGSGAANYKLAARGSVALSDSSYWLAYREGSILVWRFAGELQAGETSQITDNVPQGILDAIGIASETALPSYASDIRGVAQESLVKRIGTLTDAVGDPQEDRSGYLRSDDVITWTGTEVDFTQDLILELLNTKSGTLTQHRVLLAGSPITLNNLESAWILVDRTIANQTCTVKKTSITAIPAQTEANKDVFVLFRRVDVSGAQYLHIPFHKQVLNPGQTVRLGASGSGSGSGSGTGDDLDALQYLASWTDTFGENPSNANSSINASAGFTTATFNPASQLYAMSYDASKTATGTGTSMHLSATPSYTVAVGDILRVGTEARKITALGSINADGGVGTPFTIELAFSTNPSATAACVSQAVHSKDVNGLAVDGKSIVSQLTDSLSTVLVTYNDTSTGNLYNGTDPALVAYSASNDGSNFTSVAAREATLSLRSSSVAFPGAGTSLYLRFFSNATSGSGTVNLTGYKAYFHDDTATESGGVVNQAYCFTDSVGTPVGCSNPTVVSSKTRVSLNFSYPVGLNSGNAYGSIEVYLNGQLIPRFINATLTPDASYTESSASSIDLDKDYSALNLSVEIIQRVAVVDSNTQNTTNITSINQHQFKNGIINSDFYLAQRGTSFSSPATNVYTLDRWTHVYDGSSGTFAISQQAHTLGQTNVPDEPQYYIRWDQTVAGAGDTKRRLVQRIEGVRSYAGKTIAVSFWAKADSSRTLSVAARQNFGSGGGGSPSADVNISAVNYSATSAWQQFTVLLNIPSVLGKTLDVDSSGIPNDYLEIIWNVPLNATFQLNLSQVMVNQGSVASPWVLHSRDRAGEIISAQRFYEKSYNMSDVPGSAISSGSVGVSALTGTASNQVPGTRFKVTKLTVPALKLYSLSGTANMISNSGNTDYGGSWTSFQAPGQNGWMTTVTTSGGISGLDQVRFHYTADAELY